jgi:cephalosporin-C deacetylase-like acetyl esterase
MMYLRTLLSSAAAVVCFASTPCRSDEATSLDLSRGWTFRLGDDVSWSRPSVKDEGWKSIRVGRPWEREGHANHDGYAWYRLRLHIPTTLRRHADFRHFGVLKLSLGRIDDVDQTWMNGKLIGSTGSFPDDYETSWRSSRTYTVPGKLIRWNDENLIAVRVYDGSRDGGMLRGPYRLEPAAWRDLARLELDLGREDGMHHHGDRISVAAVLKSDPGVKTRGTVRWKCETDEGVAVAERKIGDALSSDGESRSRFEISPGSPGFYRVTCTLTRDGDSDDKISVTRTIGYRPTEIRSPVTKSPDFDRFWSSTLDELKKVDPKFSLERKPQLDSTTHEVFEVEMRSLGEIRVRGWYERPKSNAETQFPALLRVPGYSSRMRPSGDSDPWAIFSFNIRAHGRSQDDVSGKPEDYWIRGLDDEREYFYRGAYADCVRAVDFLVSRPEIDASRIAVTGGSQGGGLSLATAALDPRIALCAPDIAFLCDWVKYFKASHWPEMDDWVKAKPSRTWKTTLETLSYFDTLNLADRIRCPVLFGIGLQDPVCPAATIFAVYQRISSPKEYRVYRDAGHWVDKRHERTRRKWMRDHFIIGPK